MRRRPALLLAVLTAALLVPAAPALAHPSVPLDPTLPTDLTFASTDNVEYLGASPSTRRAGRCPQTASASSSPTRDTLLVLTVGGLRPRPRRLATGLSRCPRPLR